MASVTKRNGSYKIVVTTGRDINGKQIRHITTFTPSKKLTPKQEQRELERFVFEYEESIRGGRVYDGSKLTLSQFAQKWLREYAKQNLRQRTYESYEKMLSNRILPLMGHLKLAQITPLHVEEFKNRLLSDGIRTDGKPGGYSPSGAKKYFAILSSILSTAVKWNLIDSNPCVKAGAPKQDRSMGDIKHFTLEQANIFLQSIENEGIQHKTIAYLALFSGVRVGELSALTWHDVDFLNNTINIDKSTAKLNRGQIITPPKNNGSVRNISISEEVVDLLKQLRKYQKVEKIRLGSKWVETNFVFKQWNGTQINYDTPSHWFKKHLKRYNEGIMNSDLSDEEKEKLLLPKITFHGLRHTSATLLIAESVDVRTVSARLGHAQTSTTMNIYAHSLRKSDQKASELLGNILRKEKK